MNNELLLERSRKIWVNANLTPNQIRLTEAFKKLGHELRCDYWDPTNKNLFMENVDYNVEKGNWKKGEVKILLQKLKKTKLMEIQDGMPIWYPTIMKDLK